MENTNSNLVGLTDSEVQKRIDEGKVNISTNIKTKSIKRIFCDNIFTLFNLINVILLAALISNRGCVGSTPRKVPFVKQ